MLFFISSLHVCFILSTMFVCFCFFVLCCFVFVFCFIIRNHRSNNIINVTKAFQSTLFETFAKVVHLSPFESNLPSAS